MLLLGYLTRRTAGALSSDAAHRVDLALTLRVAYDSAKSSPLPPDSGIAYCNPAWLTRPAVRRYPALSRTRRAGDELGPRIASDRNGLACGVGALGHIAAARGRLN